MELPPFKWPSRWRTPLGDGYAYCRCSLRFWQGRGVRVLDLADLYLPESQRGQGVFTAFLERAEALVAARDDYDGIYVENVLNPSLSAFLQRRAGYELAPVPGGEGAPSFIWLRFT